MRGAAFQCLSRTLPAPPHTPQVLIERGELLTGTLCKRTVGTGGGGLIHVIWEEHGPAAARSFLNQTQLLVNYWLLQHSFSVGIGDTIADEATMHTINNTILSAKARKHSARRAAGAARSRLPPPPHPPGRGEGHHSAGADAQAGGAARAHNAGVL